MHEKTWWLPRFVWKGNSCISFIPSWGPIPKSLPPARTNLTELQTCSSVLHYLLNFFSRLLQLLVRENFSKLNCYKWVWVFCQYKPPTLGCIFCTRCFRSCLQWLWHSDPDSRLESSCIARKRAPQEETEQEAKSDDGEQDQAAGHSSYSSRSALQQEDLSSAAPVSNLQLLVFTERSGGNPHGILSGISYLTPDPFHTLYPELQLKGVTISNRN